jgi:hypothetical protein
MGTQTLFSESWLETVLAEIVGNNTVGIVLTGSYARDEQTPTSDVDLRRFVAALPSSELERYALQCREGRLISVSTTTLSEERKKFAIPEAAIWVVPGLREARLLYDPSGEVAELIRDAFDFHWEEIQAEADAYASYQIMGYAEEVHKIIGGLNKRDDSAVLYATLGLVLGLTQTIAVQRGVLIPSENRFFDLVQQAAGRESPWTCAFRLACGMTPESVFSTVESRGKGALSLYQVTSKMLSGVTLQEHRLVINHALKPIEHYLNG